MLNGQGKTTYKDGTIEKGEFKKGKFKGLKTNLPLLS